MANILDELSGLVTPSLLNQVTSFTGESDSAVSKGLSALLPSLMGGLVDKAETGGSGFTQIFDMLKGSNSQGMLDNLPSLMKGESVAGIPSDVTSGFMSMLFLWKNEFNRRSSVFFCGP